jgi:hypothetical protein
MHDADDETLQHGKFITYSEARKVVQFESYHGNSEPCASIAIDCQVLQYLTN